jgi:O-acetyl-ADP-ribose deacetylase (regulator of RNase III)
VVRGDITAVEVDAIVNAANAALTGGGGVDGAIHGIGGPAIMAACRRIGGCAPGDAVATTAGALPATWVIHTVGPIWTVDDADRHRETLASAYRRSLEVAEDLGARSVAFPNISTGVYRFPKALAADIAVATVRDAVADSLIEKVVFVCFDDENEQLYRERV